MNLKRVIGGALVASSLVSLLGCSDGTAQQSSYDTESPLVAAALANLSRIDAEIDRHHLNNYRLEGSRAEQFVEALHVEYADHPELLQRRLQAVASMVFFSAPEVETDPNVGRMTPFHGMDESGFEALMDNEDIVFNHHMSVNGGQPDGVRPFSVCETKFLVTISKGLLEEEAFVNDRRIVDYDAYAQAYAANAQTCPGEDLAEWYNFRGLGALRPSWVEANLADRFLRRMLSKCRNPKPEWEEQCAQWDADRLAYRNAKNTELALREVYYDPSPESLIDGMSFEDYLDTPQNGGVLVEDRDGDGIGEWIAEGSLRLSDGVELALPKGTTISLAAGTAVTVAKTTTVMSGGSSMEIAKGIAAVLDETVEAALTSKQAFTLESSSLALPSGRAFSLPAGATLRLEDGGIVGVPQSWEAADVEVQVKLAGALALDFAADQTLSLSIDSPTSGFLKGSKFAGELHVPIELVSGRTVLANVDVQDVIAYQAVHPEWRPEFLEQADLGLTSVFSDSSGCLSDDPQPEACPLVKRFYSLIDRHEYFYKTYSGLQPTSALVSQQPSPLVACSVTLRASHHWDKAGTPDDGVAGFIYLMRIPFEQIFSGDRRSIDTLGLLADVDGDGYPDGSLYAGPDVMDIQEVYEQGRELDMNEVWLDIATLSNNQYAGEHEISKFGTVATEQIEGILVVRRPAAMGGQ